MMKPTKTSNKTTIVNELVSLMDQNGLRKKTLEIEHPYVRALFMLMDRNMTDKNSFMEFYVILLKLNSVPIMPLDSIEFLMNNYMRNPNFFKHLKIFCAQSKNLTIPLNIWKSIIFSTSVLNSDTKYFELKTELFIEIISSNLEYVKNYNLDSFCKNLYKIKDEVIEKRIKEVTGFDTSIATIKINDEIKQPIFGLFLYWSKKIIRLNAEVHINLSRLLDVQFAENKKWIDMSTEIEEFLEFMETKLPAGYLMNKFTQIQIKKLATIFQVKKQLFLRTVVTTDELIKADFILEPFFKKFIIPKVFFKCFFGLDSNQHSLLLHVLEGKSISSYTNLPLKMDKKSCQMLLNEIVIDDIHYWAKEVKNLWDYFAVAKILANGNRIGQLDVYRIILSMHRFGGSYDFWIENMLIIINKHNGRTRIDLSEIADYIYNKVLVNKEHLDLNKMGIHTLLKHINLWHLELMKGKLEKVMLPKSEIKKFNYQENQASQLFIIRQLNNSYELFKEGKELRHCVRSYDKICIQRKTFIFSLRIVENENEKPLITIEVRDGKIFQAKGKYNRPANNDEIEIIKLWAEKENLEIRNTA